jgi:hypothetical protein
MSNVPQLSDPNHFVHPVKASARVATLNAGDTGAELARNGLQIDRFALPRTFRSVEVVQPFRITQDTARSLTVKLKVQHRSSTTGAGSTWADVTALLGGSTGTKTVTNTTTSTDQVTDSAAVVGIPLAGCKRYLRCVTTPDVSATTTGPTFDLDAAVAVFSGPDRTPAQG